MLEVTFDVRENEKVDFEEACKLYDKLDNENTDYYISEEDLKWYMNEYSDNFLKFAFQKYMEDAENENHIFDLRFSSKTKADSIKSNLEERGYKVIRRKDSGRVFWIWVRK